MYQLSLSMFAGTANWDEAASAPLPDMALLDDTLRGKRFVFRANLSAWSELGVSVSEEIPV